MDQKRETQQMIKRVKQIISLKITELAMKLQLSKTGSSLIGIFENHLKVWSIANQVKLLRKQQFIECKFILISLSKQCNWFISVNEDFSVFFWKEQVNGIWIGKESIKKHYFYVYRIFLYSNEDYLISTGMNGIMVWKVDIKKSILEYYDNISKIDAFGFQIAINQPDNKLIAWREYGLIALWSKEKESYWRFLNQINDDNLKQDLYFFSDKEIACKIPRANTIKMLKISKNEKLVKRPELLLDERSGSKFINSSVSTISNNKKGVFVQNHDDQIYFLQRQQNGTLKRISENLTVGKIRSITISENGQILGIYSSIEKTFNLYKIQY